MRGQQKNNACYFNCIVAFLAFFISAVTSSSCGNSNSAGWNVFHSSVDGKCDRARAPVCVSLEPSVPAASLNNPVLSVHSGVCGSASALSPEAVDTKREERGREANALCSASRDRNQHMISDTLAQDMLPCSYPFIWWFKRLTKTGGPQTRKAISANPLQICASYASIFHHLHQKNLLKICTNRVDLLLDTHSSSEILFGSAAKQFEPNDLMLERISQHLARQVSREPQHEEMKWKMQPMPWVQRVTRSATFPPWLKLREESCPSRRGSKNSSFDPVNLIHLWSLLRASGLREN